MNEDLNRLWCVVDEAEELACLLDWAGPGGAPRDARGAHWEELDACRDRLLDRRRPVEGLAYEVTMDRAVALRDGLRAALVAARGA